MVRNLFSGGTYRSTNAESRSRLTADDIDLLVALSCYRGSLATGSPCSPFIANRIMASFDQEIAARLGEGFVYSRYSDDICISSSEWINSAEISTFVGNRLRQKGFDLNNAKLVVLAGHFVKSRVSILTAMASFDWGLKEKQS